MLYFKGKKIKIVYTIEVKQTHKNDQSVKAKLVLIIQLILN
jgi:hypothetical protein